MRVCAQSCLLLLLAQSLLVSSPILASFPYCPCLHCFVCLLCFSSLCLSTFHTCTSIASLGFLSVLVGIFHTCLHLTSTPVPYLIFQTCPSFLIVGKSCQLSSSVFYLSFCTAEEMEGKKDKWLHLTALSRKQTPLSVPLK